MLMLSIGITSCASGTNPYANNSNIGGVIGARFGVIASKRVNGARARVVLALIVLAVCTKVAMSLFLEPGQIFVIEI